MTCTDCIGADETKGAWLQFNPACLHCGARYIQWLGRQRLPSAVVTARRREVLAAWLAHGHDEAEIRELIKGPMAVTPKESKRR